VCQLRIADSAVAGDSFRALIVQLAAITRLQKALDWNAEPCAAADRIAHDAM
jgi:hypothetical protein